MTFRSKEKCIGVSNGMKKHFIVVSIVIIGAVGLFFMQNKKSESKDSNQESVSDVSSQKDQNGGVKEVEMHMVILKDGSGEQTAKAGDAVTVHYVGTLENGIEFDSSRAHGQPFRFALGAGQVIKGWDAGIVGMRVGEIRKFTIPPELAYGANAVGDIIPANSTLIFEVELLGIE